MNISRGLLDLLQSSDSYPPANLEDMECFKLDVPAAISQHIHHELEVLWVADVAGHHCVVMPVQKQLS